MKIPNCVGIIMDGNRRWAKNKGMLALKGHHAGGEKLKEVVRWVRDADIKHVIFYAFSTENWNRSEEEVSYLLNLIAEFLQKEFENFHKEGGVLHCVGDISRFSLVLQKILKDVEEKTKDNSGPHIYLALNYGGRQEILSAVKKIVAENPKQEDITEEYLAKYLQTGDMPDPDIIIRTSGEMRLSGFLPWQGVYSELFFTPAMWPDFSKEEFLKILEEYGERDRRHGK
ncbi:MAG: di-trans,poly-cis-decaprenylcistransferase [Candidatus Levybacteria bacterium RIFCSPHIGHO2_01_FULL_37_33]|uniref:Isoprenyl transferase n=3 Tax=Candidatus Zambryskiibacteriota TaxID=1817925 RepID=A0A1G2T627_9BACT|nr:MAG: di-trans,poly-cis-decaprenylcistransferase [Candidatus Levybacteria bacterium RIFCSPHIGHO2_01_FULL_37_33]OHA92602.1 MAG: di-trans,poly-cis-decaprenylcistransferase [Candidatus Zambryskibacteria bacterium RIFCSPHIGHO2_02_38_10.5]OHA97737.1 MAG: di-trans,poly-cis-decaprenylcistransferase [Candidatus Zambryskibacteria bacterium RIFCSPHIGHO2_12_FULL_38_37]OHB08681.1 MAG: di-trans,poly-cis-decaprenylcistransferase [Candidatus Zambryskibacteria bacterium RIFCSPLOWO2_02_39_10]OHB13575.1 MAG: d